MKGQTDRKVFNKNHAKGNSSSCSSREVEIDSSTLNEYLHLERCWMFCNFLSFQSSSFRSSSFSSFYSTTRYSWFEMMSEAAKKSAFNFHFELHVCVEDILNHHPLIAYNLQLLVINFWRLIIFIECSQGPMPA